MQELTFEAKTRTDSTEAARAPVFTHATNPQVCAFLFQLITAVQFFFAIAANSMSLQTDCIAMQIDVVTYLGNIYAEVRRQSHELTDLDKAKISLFFSGISIGILTGLTAYNLVDIIGTLAGGSIKDDLHPAWYNIIFGGFGFVSDLICLYAFSIWGDPGDMGINAKGAPAACDMEGGAPGAPDTTPGAPATMQPRMSKVRSAAVTGTEVADKKSSAMNMCGSLSHVLADSIRSITSVCVGIAACGWKRKVNGARADAIGALICSVTIIAVMIFICIQWVRMLKVYLNYDQYEDTHLERPSTKPQGIAHVISSATSFYKKDETLY